MSGYIPKEFRQGKCKATTVGELIELLGRLPDDLPLYCGFADHVDVVVTRVNNGGSALRIDEGEME